MKTQICILLLFTLIIKSKAQSTRIEIGQTLTNTHLANLVNYSHSKASLTDSSLNGKIIILDFWGTTCKPCIEKMPQLAALQKKFDSEIKIFLVTTESKKSIETFYQRRKDLKQLNLPIETDAKLLKGKFPYLTIPHIVWIGKDKKIKAITYARDFNEDNLLLLIKNGNITLPIKRDILDLDYDVPILKSTINAIDKLLYSSTLTKSIEGVNTGLAGFRDLKDGRIKLFAFNRSILALYKFAYQERIDLNLSFDRRTKIFLSVSDKSKFQAEDSTESPNYQFCYEQIMPFTLLDDRNKYRMLEIMQKDLDRFFGVKSEVKKVYSKCFSVTTEIKNKNTDSSYITETIDRITLINQPMAKVIAIIKLYLLSELPIIWEGPSDTKVSFSLSKNKQHISSLKLVLQSFGILVNEAERDIDMLVISDNY